MVCCDYVVQGDRFSGTRRHIVLHFTIYGPSVLPWRELSGEGENDRHTVSEELQRAAVQLLQKSLLRDHHMRIETQTRFTVV